MAAGPADRHYATGHIPVISAAAHKFGVSILVRRTNPASVPYIGRQGYVPKPLTCKAKTAKNDVFLSIPGSVPGRLIKCAGLVVNPRINGFRAAFDTAGQYTAAVTEWDQEFRMRLDPSTWKYGWDEKNEKWIHISGEPPDGSRISFREVNGPRGSRTREGSKFHVDYDRSSDHFGCVLYGSNASSASYMHGDYDLYGIVAMDKASDNSVIRDVMYRKEYNVNNYGPEFEAVAGYLNNEFKRISGPRCQMIRHGSQEKYAPSHGDEELDVFWPDGRVTYVAGESAIWNLYKDAFNSRPVGTRSMTARGG